MYFHYKSFRVNTDMAHFPDRYQRRAKQLNGRYLFILYTKFISIENLLARAGNF